MKMYIEELKQYIRSKQYLFAVLLIAVISYGYAVMNVSVSIDDLEVNRYVGNGNDLLASGRFGTVLWAILFGYRDNLVVNSGTIDLIAVIMLIWAATNFCILFQRIAKEKINESAYTFFSCVLISYPLMNEIWEYTGANLNVCGGFLLVSFSLLLIYDHTHNDRNKSFFKLMLASILMMWVCAGYESLVPVYIFFTFAILALQMAGGENKENKISSMIKQGMLYAAILVIGILLRIIVHSIILFVMDLDKGTNGATAIQWFLQTPSEIIKRLVYDYFLNYFLKGIIYFPLTELVVSVIVFICMSLVAWRKYGKEILLPCMGMLFSLIVLSLVQGVWSQYRMCQVFGSFVAFVVFCSIAWIQKYKWKRWVCIKKGVFVLAGFLCIYQAIYMNYFLTLNHMRSEEEKMVVHTVGMELQDNYQKDKPVIFVGRYQLSEYIQEAASVPKDAFIWKVCQYISSKCYGLMGREDNSINMSRKLPQTNINSALAWAEYAFEQEAMWNIFHYYGYQYTLADYKAVYAEACETAREYNMPCYPNKGYIQEEDEYIIVRLGPIY